ncbi:hypothetical protein J2Y63_007015 [Shinella sp. BE166]
MFGIHYAMLAEPTELAIRKIAAEGLTQQVVGRVTDAQKGYLAVGDIHFIADDPLPGGIDVGDIIALECARIDLW